MFWAGLLALLGGAVLLVVVMVAQGVDRAGIWASVLGTGLAIAGALATLVTWRLRQRSTGRQQLARTEQVPGASQNLQAAVRDKWRQEYIGVASGLSAGEVDVLNDLADAVRSQWEAEEQIRRVHDPFPMPVRVVNAPEQLTDHWQNVHGVPTLSDPINVNDSGLDLFGVFNRVPSRRLVVLGAAGSGKTILSSRFVLSSLSSRTPGSVEPVPIIFSLGSWNPHFDSLRSWMSRQLTVDYPALAARDTRGRTLADRMVDAGLILPVLDGFDEIGEIFRTAAIIRINSSLRPRDSLLLTSRPDEYAEAINSSDVLTAALVVQLEDLSIDDLALYLPLTTRRNGAVDSQTKWHPVVQAMRNAEPESNASALSSVLSMPLMVALARASFSDTSADPNLLLHFQNPPANFDTDDRKSTLEYLLLDGFVPSAYDYRYDTSDPVRNRLWRLEESARWLGFLASHMADLKTRDFAWWRLHRGLSRMIVSLSGGIAISLPIFLVTVFLSIFGTWPDDGQFAFIGGTGFAMMSGVGGALLLWQGYGIQLIPLRMQLRLRWPAKNFLRIMGDPMGGWQVTLAWFVTWCGSGLGAGLVAWRAVGHASAPVVGLLAALSMAIGIFVLVGLVRLLGAPIDSLEAISPRNLLSVDRRTAIQQGAIIGIGGSMISWCALLLGVEPAVGEPFEQIFHPSVWGGAVLLTSVGGALIWIVFFTVWGRWLMARFWLPLTGRLPWAVMDFLEDAHRRGVLRRAGAVYQFRHARLQDRLVASKQLPISERSEVRAVERG